MKTEEIPTTSYLTINKFFRIVKNHGINSMARLVLEHAPKCLFFLSIKTDGLRKEHFGHLNKYSLVVFGQ